jgi:predicted ArsR family transcriptional regulator
MSTQSSPGDTVLAHPVRAALLALVRERGTLTSTEAARQLGHSSGLCSFHLRQLARYGYLEEADHGRGRVRPWRLAAGEAEAEPPGDDGFGALARDLEDEGYRRWLAGQQGVPPEWRRDEAFSMVLQLTAAELAEAAGEIRAVLERYRRAGDRYRGGTRPVAAVARLFPLLPADPAAE